MAQQTTISHQCGHTSERYLHGRAAKIAHQITMLSERNCADCGSQPRPVRSTSAAQRKLVKLGSVQVGDVVDGKPVTGLGTHWFCNSADDGMTDPWLDGQYVQYAYFN